MTRSAGFAFVLSHAPNNPQEAASIDTVETVVMNHSIPPRNL
jgi:hypothetical protein